MFELYDINKKQIISKHNTIEKAIKARVNVHRSARVLGLKQGRTEILHNGALVSMAIWSEAEEHMIKMGKV